MVHLELALYASPDTHEDFIRQINDWKYKCEGKERTGDFAPFISEIRMYDIRLPKEIMPQFLRDIKAYTPTSPFKILRRLTNKKYRKLFYWLAEKLIKLFYPFKIPEAAEGEQQYKLVSWHNFFLLAELEDDSGTNMLTGEKREVL